ncbi:hypothetical protein QBZ16_001248 [Prototheca wickerhamii]|uniref:Uncharacterized protein n=1 Tax=Prototheca wickerhamii TaxID=3111 RepID=A0AAD9IGV3_PROWI|nr:hypothetical protein QBZ16_001248 [Prototheca wickerhamii]
MLAFDGHHLASSPLCLSVPLEGTDKVPGLHAIERVAADQEDEAAPSSPQTVSPFKIKGRRVQELVLDDVKAEPRPWSEFAGWGCRTLDDAYNVPPDLATLSIRALSVALGIATWLAVSRTGCLPFLLLGLVLAALSVGAHASLRRVGAAAPSSTARLAVRLPLLRRMASPASPARLPPAAQGWSFGQVLGVSAVPEGAQPRLVLKQGVARAWRGCRGAVVRVWRAAGLRARHWWSARGLERR